jgi:hypothetical protein
MDLSKYAKEQIIFATRSGIDHIVWDMLNNNGVVNNSNDEFFDNFREALRYLEIDCSSIENMDKTNVLTLDREIFEIAKKFNQKYKNVQGIPDCDILGEN